MGHKLVAQAIIGGYTQFLTMAQGMPPEIKAALTKITHNFIWEGSTKSKIALGNLQHLVKKGGLNLLDIKARDDTIEIMWLKTYLNLSLTHPTWMKVTNLIINALMPQETRTQT